MAQYRVSVKGQRGGASRLGGKSSGISASIHGWHLGINAYASYDAKTDCDSISVRITAGNGHGEPRYNIKEERNAEGLLTGFTVSEKPAEEACGA